MQLDAIVRIKKIILSYFEILFEHFRPREFIQLVESYTRFIQVWLRIIKY